MLLKYKLYLLIKAGVNKEIIIDSLLTHDHNISQKFNALSANSELTQDFHLKLINNYFRKTTIEWKKNGIIDENVNNNNFTNLIKIYKQYKDFAIDYREKAGGPCNLFEDYKSVSHSGPLLINPTDFAQTIDKLYNAHHGSINLTYLMFKKLLTLNSNFKIQDNVITFNNLKEDNETGDTLNIAYNMFDQTLNTLFEESTELTKLVWNNDNSQSILTNLFETELGGNTHHQE